MGAPSYTTDLTLINTANATTNWSEPGAPETGGGTPQNGTEFFIEGTACISKACAGVGGISGGVLYDALSGLTIAADDAVYIWLVFAAPNTLLDRSAGGFAVCVGSSTTAYRKWYVLGKDNYAYGGWVCVAVDPAVAGSIDIGSPSGTRQYFGGVVKTSATISKGEPFGVDVVRHGRTLQITDGVGDPGTFAGAAAANDEQTAARWGIFQAISGGYQLQGRFLLGTAAAAVDFRDLNTTILIANTLFVTAGFNVIEVRNASSRVDFTAVSFSALGTVSRGNFLVTHNADVNIDSCSFTGMGTFALLGATAITNSTLRSCDTITAPGSDLRGTSVLTSRVAADAGALVWNVSTNPTGLLDDMTFSIGTNAHHAINFGASAPQTITLNGISFTGFNASHEQNDSTLLFSDTGANVTWTVNLVGCSGNISYKKVRAGDTVDLVSNPVSLSIHVQDINTADAIVGARVWVPVTSTASGRPFNQTISTILVQADPTYRVTFAAAHNLVTNDYLHISGCNEPQYNKTFQVTFVDSTKVDITVPGSPGAATGTPVGKWVIINGTTNGSGDISASYTYQASQPISGRVRLSTSPSYYKTAPISGTVNSSSGLPLTILMIPDS